MGSARCLAFGELVISPDPGCWWKLLRQWPPSQSLAWALCLCDGRLNTSLPQENMTSSKHVPQHVPAATSKIQEGKERTASVSGLEPVTGLGHGPLVTVIHRVHLPGLVSFGRGHFSVPSPCGSGWTSFPSDPSLTVGLNITVPQALCPAQGRT